MIYHDGGRDSLAFFREHRQLIREVQSVKLSNEENIAYPFKIVGEMGEIWLPRLYVFVLLDLGYPEEAIDAARKNSEFEFGPPKNWKPKVVPGSGRRITQAMLGSAAEVLCFLEMYHYRTDNMPTAREIVSNCDSVTSTSMAHHRLRMLQEQGHIHVERRKHRGITLL